MGVLAAAVVVLALIPAAALGAPDPVLADCNLHLHLTRSYSIAQLQHALQVMPADMAQYSDCPTVIRQALDSELAAVRPGLGAAGGADGGGVPVWLITIGALVAAGGGTASLLAWRRQRS